MTEKLRTTPPFTPVSPQVDFLANEREVLRFWKARKIFERSMQEREGGEPFVFYEGPPTANGKPHVGHVITRVYKDIFPRYHTMKGRFVLRKAGWDTHGLPVEIEVEKQLGLTGKEQVEAFGIAKFNELCRASVWKNVDIWADQTERLAYWVNLDDAYVTMTNDYIESVWNILKRFWDDGLLYEGYKVVPYCPRCGTPLSSHEVSQGYKEVEDPSLYIKMPLVDEPNRYFLVWTTTPWTLPSNAALAVGEAVDYVLVDTGEEQLWVAKALADSVLPKGGVKEWAVVREAKGKALLGQRYHPLFRFLPFGEEAHYVLPADFVSTSDGTGIVHIAPPFGQDDMTVGRQNNLPVLLTVAADGTFVKEAAPYAGMFVKEADPQIVADLHERGLVHHAGRYEHSYPFCWRCHTPLLYYARETWYIETTRYKDRLLANNNKINWMPDTIRTGRFGNWLENNVDWALGRERFWATPLPVWRCDSEACGHTLTIGSVAELSDNAGRDLSEMDLHRPFIDEITWSCRDCGTGTMRRVPEVIDVWFDSGSMPYAQWHYPFENEEIFEQQYPADYICEAIDQTRGWFYSLHAISTLLYDQPAFKNVIVLGHVVDAEGKKMSKSIGNVVDPYEVLNAHGADATRWYFFSANPPWNTTRFSADLVGDVVRKFMLTLWNSYSFFVSYANIEGWKPTTDAPTSEHRMDRWLLSELNRLVVEVDAGLAAYDAYGTSRAIAAFVDSLSNWYVRRSRSRFWAGDGDALHTLYHSLKTVALLIAPYVPFLAETLWQNLRTEADADSAHLAHFPPVDEARIDEPLSRAMATVQQVASLGHAARNQAGLKVRQPLQAVVAALPGRESEGLRQLEQELLDELNVKALMLVEGAELATYRIGPDPAVYGKQLGRNFPKLRQTLNNMDATPLALKLLDGESVTVAVEGVDEPVTLTPDTVLVVPEPREGYAVVQDGAYTVGVTTELSEALIAEGYARELSRAVNQLRKDAGLALTDRIELWIDGAPDGLLDEWGDFLQAETLATALHRAPAPQDTATATLTLGDAAVNVGLRR
ncbi:MAG: isoleucine--tRNA ligase [Anaerolineales bacterium]|nr:isoleucine--tRNA ligase [Anaerolineales bacterium]